MWRFLLLLMSLVFAGTGTSAVDFYRASGLASPNRLTSYANRATASALEVPYSIDFGQTQEGWTTLDMSEKPGKTWIFNAKGWYEQGVYRPCVTMDKDYSSIYNDYYISPAIQLNAGTYIIKTVVGCSSSGPSLSLHKGTNPTDASSFELVNNLELPYNYNADNPAVNTVTINKAGTYYFAFLGTTAPYNPTVCCLFSFSIEAEGGITNPDPEEPVALPYTIDFRESAAGWTGIDNDGDNITWVQTTGVGATAERMNPNTKDDWLSPEFQLKANKEYVIYTKITGMKSEDNEHFKLMAGSGKNTLDFAEVSKLTMQNSGENNIESIYHPKTNGIYRFAIRNTYHVYNNILYLYTFEIKEREISIDDKTPIYETDFSSQTMEGWTAKDANYDRNTWDVIQGIQGITYNGELASGEANDWIFSPAIALKSGQDYILEYTMEQSSAFDADKVTLHYGNGPAPEFMSKELFTEEIVSKEGIGKVSRLLRITAKTTENMYFGFHIQTPEPNGKLTLKAFSITPKQKATPMPVKDFTATSDPDAKQVTFNWSNPILDTETAALTEAMQVKIYEEETEIVSLSNMLAGTTASYSYHPNQFEGEVTYKIVAVLGEKMSEPVYTTINLDDIQGDIVLIKQFTMGSKELFQEWKVENENGGNTWEYNYQCASIYYGKSHSDWLISPAVRLEAGQRYLIQYEAQTDMGFGADFDLTIGDAQRASAQTSVLASHQNLEQNGFGEFQTAQFEVPTTKDYYIAFKAKVVNNKLSIRNIRINYIGKQLPVKSLPYAENFDASESMPDGWKAINVSETQGFQVAKPADLGIASLVAHSAPNIMYLPKNATSGEDCYVFTPKFELDKETTYDIHFQLQMPGLATDKQSLSVYIASDQRIESLPATPLYTQSGEAFNTWQKQRIRFKPEANGSFLFAFRVEAPEAGAGYVAIDDFTLNEAVSLVPPAAPFNLQGTVKGNNTVELYWNNPSTDKDGFELVDNTLIKTLIYENGELLGEVSGKIMKLMTFTKQYEEDQYNGQKIYKAVSYIEDIQGEASTTLITISNPATGMLSQTVADYKFDGTETWTVINADNDEKEWTVSETALNAQTDGSDDWLVSPITNLEPGKSYFLTCQIQTNNNDGADIAFTQGNKQTIEGQTDLAVYQGLTLGKKSVLEINKTFTATETENYFGIHVTNNTGTVTVSGLKVIRVFTEDEPENIPFEEDFEDLSSWNDRTEFLNKWGRMSSTNTTNYRFLAMDMEKEYEIPAHSDKYALAANEFPFGERLETLYTPMFDLQKGKTYDISYYLYMPGNTNPTILGIFASPTQVVDDMEETLLQEVSQPVKEWTKQTFTYTAQEDSKRCFFFHFIAQAEKAGIIALDDFSIKESTGTHIQQAKGQATMFYVPDTQTLVVSPEAAYMQIYNTQGYPVMSSPIVEAQINLADLPNGFYLIQVTDKEGKITVLKIRK